MPEGAPDILVGDEPLRCRCRKCGKEYEGDGIADNGLCYDCDNA
jgi:hypothetical protein